MTDWKAVGRKAFECGEPGIPMFNAEVHAAIAGLPVGGGAEAIFRDFIAGWMAANLAAPIDIEEES